MRVLNILYYTVSVEPDSVVHFKLYTIENNTPLNIGSFDIAEFDKKDEDTVLKEIKSKISENGIGYKKIQRL